MNKRQNHHLIALVEKLNDGEYHDGNSLGEMLGMTRSAIWKSIKKLESYGISIQSDKRKGYALEAPLLLLNPDTIFRGLPATCQLTVFESISSTNDYLKSVKKNKQIQICLAEQQTQGRGRLNREWVSPFGKNIYLSCLYPFAKDISELAGLSLVVSLAMVNMLKLLGVGQGVMVKWPNDILHANQKLSGALIDVQAESNGACHAVIGIGLNVNMLADDSGQISQPWTSMQAISGSYLDRNVVAVTLINQLLVYLDRFSQRGFVDFMDEWMAVDCLLHQTISIKNLHHTLTGKVMGINAQGHLLLVLPSGETRTVSSGDASVVKNI
jgi:BirA family biotin operon repressor/biotin-[acetyl-CoA-carboxylase] ligase